MKTPRLGLTTQALLGVCALLGLIVGGESLRGTPLRQNELAADEAAPAELPAIDAARYVHPSLGSFADVLERPLFVEARRFPEEVVAAAPAPSVPLRLELEGIAMVGATRIAVLRDGANKALVQLGEGATHNGWTLDNVSADKARFSRGAQTEVLTLDLAANVQPRR